MQRIFRHTMIQILLLIFFVVCPSVMVYAQNQVEEITKWRQDFAPLYKSRPDTFRIEATSETEYVLTGGPPDSQGDPERPGMDPLARDDIRNERQITLAVDESDDATRTYYKSASKTYRKGYDTPYRSRLSERIRNGSVWITYLPSVGFGSEDRILISELESEEPQSLFAEEALFITGQFSHWNHEEYRSVYEIALEADAEKMSIQPDTIDGNPVKRIEIPNENGVDYTLWIDMNHGGLTRKVELVLLDKLCGQNSAHHNRTSKALKVIEILEDVLIEYVDEHPMITSATFRFNGEFVKGEVDTRIRKFNMTKIEVNPEFEGTDTFSLARFPDGTRASTYRDGNYAEGELENGEITLYPPKPPRPEMPKELEKEKSPYTNPWWIAGVSVLMVAVLMTGIHESRNKSKKL
jgi:hypothetical protein